MLFMFFDIYWFISGLNAITRMFWLYKYMFVIYSTKRRRPHFLWIDNFCKFISRSVPTADRSVFSSCLWTGATIFMSLDDQIDMSLQYGPNQRVVSAMPSDILQTRQVVDSSFRLAVSLGPNYYDSSLVNTYDIRNIPLKVDTVRFPNVSATVNAYTMQQLYTTDLIELNIGSNRGLASIINKLYIDHISNDANDDVQTYMNLNVDENIFWRILKVLLVYVCE